MRKSAPSAFGPAEMEYRGDKTRGGEDEGGRERDKTEPAALRQQAERRGEAEQKQQRKPGARSGREKDNRQRRMHRFA